MFPDGRRIVSGSYDGTIKVWDLATGKCVAMETSGGFNPIKGVAVFPDGRRVVSGASKSNKIKVWNAATGECVATLRGISSDASGVRPLIVLFSPGFVAGLERCRVSGRVARRGWVLQTSSGHGVGRGDR